MPDFAHLRDRPRRALQRGQSEGLDGVDREHAGAQLARVLQRDGDIRLGRQVQPGRERAQPYQGLYVSSRPRAFLESLTADKRLSAMSQNLLNA